MTGTGEVLLGVIAVSVLVMAGIQVGAVIAGMRLARRVETISRQIDQDIKPLIRNLTAVSEEAVHTAALASRQVERVDQMFGDLSARLDQTVASAQEFVQGPARNGMAIISGVQAAVSAFKGMREASRRRRTAQPGTEDDSLFIG